MSEVDVQTKRASRLSQSSYSPVLFCAIGLSYILILFTGHVLGLAAGLYLVANLHRRPSLYDLIPLFMIVDIFPEHTYLGFELPFFSTIIFNIYFVKVLCFALMYSRLNLLPILILVLVVAISTWRGLNDTNSFSTTIAVGDIKTLLAVSFALGFFRLSPTQKFPIDLKSQRNVAYYFFGVALSTIIYFLIFDLSAFYIILDSAKSIISFLLLHSILHSSYLTVLVFSVVGIFSLVILSSRMNFLIATIFFLLLGFRRAPTLTILILMAGLAGFIWASEFSIQASRIASIQNVFAEPNVQSLGPLISRLAEIDYIRAVEAHYTFQRATISELLFGRGLGTGYSDTEGYINAGFIDRYAYSLEEFRSGIFFGLHDPLVEWAFRYGIIVSSGLFVMLAKAVYRGVCEKNLIPVIISLTVLTSYWSGKGVAIILLLGFVYAFSYGDAARK